MVAGIALRNRVERAALRAGSEVEEGGLGCGRQIAEASQMTVGEFRYLAAAGGALQKALLYQEWLIYLLDGARILPYGRTDGRQSDRTALELVDDGEEYAVVYLIKAVAVYIKGLQRMTRYGEVDTSGTAHHREVAHASQQ